MKYAILSDVHGNLEALEAVLKDGEENGAERILFLGDAVGYGADPFACLMLLRRTAHVMIMGNHDMACATGHGLEDLNPDAAAAILWTRDNLGQDDMEYIESLPLEHCEGDIYLVHGSPFQPYSWHYILSEQDAERGFTSTAHHLVFVGHTHKPLTCIEVERKKLFGGEARRIELDTVPEKHLVAVKRYIINVGSVGQPRDHDPRAAYGLYDSTSRTFLLRRVTYDCERTSQKILGKGLPGFLADRIRKGI